MPKALILVAVLCLTACEVNVNSEGVVARETKSFTVAGTPDVELDTFDGAIEVHSWDRNEVEVEIEKRAMEQGLIDDMRVSAEQQGDRIVIKVSAPARERDQGGLQIGVHFSPSAHLRVALPRNTRLTAATTDGSLVIEDVHGAISLRTGDGSIRASRLAGDLTARSGDGSIRVDGLEGSLDVETEDGSITLEAAPSVVRVRTGDGSIRLKIDADSVMRQDWDVQTNDGSITLTVPSEFNALIDAETRDGSVRVSHPTLENEQRQGDSRDERRRRLKATLGSGGQTLRIRSGDGTIRIE